MVTSGRLLAQRYRLTRQLGEGGFAAVWLAEDTRLARPVALKLLKPALAADDEARARFAREARASASLRHPYLLTIHDWGEEAGLPYLAMPYVEGGTLHDLLRAGPLDLPTIGRYLGQVAAALDYAHARGVIHRDVNPHNLLLADDRRSLALADFGIARRLDHAMGDGTAALGTISYMSPEQFHGEATAAVDRYALGCTLFELLTGTPPYHGSVAAIVEGHRSGPIPRLVERTIRPLPPACQGVIDRALAKDPDARYPTAGALAAAFDAARDQDPAPTLPQQHARTTVALPPRTRTRPLAPPPRPRPTRPPLPATAYDEHGALGGRALLIAILVAAILLATWSRDHFAAPPTGTSGEPRGGVVTIVRRDG
jgi:serine/threonine-protein kinase